MRSELKVAMAEPAFLGKEVLYVNEALRNRQLSMGTFVKWFEAEVAHATGAPYAVATCNGTAALHVALLALGVRPGDRVVVPSCTYVATANAVRYCGASPVFVDVDPRTWVMDPRDAQAAAARTDAVGVITVALYGQPCPVPDGPFWVLEDLAEAHGLRPNPAARAAVFSYYGNKIVTCGEGGSVVTWDHELAAKLLLLRGQGTTGRRRYFHEVLGYNYRMTDLQAAVGVAQMETFEAHRVVRETLMRQYRAKLPTSVEMPERSPDAANWVVPVIAPCRDSVAEYLAEHGVETRPVFPPCHWQPAHQTDQYLPVSQELGRSGLLLPLHANMTSVHVDKVCAELHAAIRRCV